MSVVYTGGTFDLFHSGHVNLLRECSREADSDGKGQVVVALNTDEFITEYKGKAPIMSYDERRAVLLACRYVDRVIPNIGGADSKPAIKHVLPNVIVVGSDWRDKDYCAQMQFTPDWLLGHDISLIYVPYTPGMSTTELKKRINES